jgi:hypothetical protein
MSTYQLAQKSIADQVKKCLKQYHSELFDAGVSVDVLLAYAAKDANGDPVGPAVTTGGYACIAKIKIIGLKDRAAGRADCELILDGDRWNEFAGEERAAVIDHELTHLELCVGDDGLKRDDLERPRLRTRKHDHQFGWFDEVVRRHGKDSIEWQQYEHFEDVGYTQLWLPCIEQDART